MTVTEKAAYLKGVVSMLKLEENSDEAKVLNVLVDTIDEMAQSIASLRNSLTSQTSSLMPLTRTLTILRNMFTAMTMTTAAATTMICTR